MSNMKPVAQLPPPAPHTKASGLTRKQKAAIIVRFLLNEGAEVPLTELSDAMQADLTQQMGGMRYIDRDTLASVVMEFAEELEGIGLAFPKGIAGALSALEGKISPITAARLRKEAGVRQSGDPWQRLRDLDIAKLVPILETESTEVAAVMLSKLDVAKAAELLGHLPGDKARSITYAVSLTDAVTPEAVDRIGISLAAQLDDQPIRAFIDEPVDRVGAILNFSPAATRDDVLTGLEEADSGFAKQVRKAIFTFVNIRERINPRDVPKIVRDVEQGALVQALAIALATEGDMQDTAEFILANMSSRLADQLRESVEEAGKVSQKDGDEAQNAVVAVIRDLNANGEIQYLEPEEEEEE